jgi:predicted RNA-binding protein with TRAM domain
MSDTTELKSEVDTDLWEQLKSKFPDLDDAELLVKIIDQYSNLVEMEIDEGSLLTEFDEQRKLAESLRKKCKNFALRVKELEDFQADQEGEIQKLKKQIKKMSSGMPDFGEERVKEKIVYREDTKTINELKEKRDSLQKTLWEKNAELENYEKALNETKQKLEEFENEKGKSYGFLVKLELNKQTSKYDFAFENISRGEFNKLMRSKVEFCKYKKIFTPATVIKLWDTETDEMEIINLTEAIMELRNKSDIKMTEISLPYTEYDGLKSIEKKHGKLKEDYEALLGKVDELEALNTQLQTTTQQLNSELTNLKENPIVKEKVIVKENKKELEELKAECERLRLKLFNYETGHIKVPTHGIGVGNLYKVKILGVGKDGDGFTRVNNFIIFVPNTKKDQITIVKITRVLKKYAFGKVIEGEPDGEVIDTLNQLNQSDQSDQSKELGQSSQINENTEPTIPGNSSVAVINKDN